MTINEIKTRYGTVNYNGAEYILVQDAYTDTPVGRRPEYTALAIKADDVRDEYGCQPCYCITWDVLDEYVSFDERTREWHWTEDAEARGEDEYCDWDSPATVDECYSYNIDEGRVC